MWGRRKNEKAGEQHASRENRWTRDPLEHGKLETRATRRDALIKGVRGNKQNETRLPLRNLDTTSCCGMLSNLQIYKLVNAL